MNFLISDKKVNELDLGNIGDNTLSSIIPFFSTSVLQTNWEDLPWAEEDPSLNFSFINCPRGIFQNGNELTLSNLWSVGGLSPCIPFYVFVNKIIENFGYTVTSNVLQSTLFQYLYVLNSTFSIAYAKMLPGWTISEFFEEVEKLFNVVVLIDEFTKKVEIRFRNDFYETEPVVFIDKVLDAYIQKIDPENRTDYSVANFGYATDSDEYFTFQNMDPKILRKARIMRFPSFDEIVDYINTTQDSLNDVIFVAEDSNTQYICYLGEKLDQELYYPKKVNAFEPIRNNPDSDNIDIEFKIQPAPMRVFDIPVFTYGSYGAPPLFYLRTQMPIISTIPWNPGNEDGNMSIQKVLEGEESIDQQETSNLFLCFFQGTRTIFEPDKEGNTTYRQIDYPMPFVDFLYEFNIIGERKINDNKHRYASMNIANICRCNQIFV
jgi:hypothetical protein